MKLILSPLAFSDLQQNLEICDDLFLKHQVRLMHKDYEKALAIFEQLLQIRTVHLKVMEQILIPAFINALAKIPDGAKPLYFEREKKQILKYLNNNIKFLSNLLLHSNHLDIVSLFEGYAWLKDLLDHHDAREKAFLFPVLDKIPQDKKQHLLAEISGQLAVLEEVHL